MDENEQPGKVWRCILKTAFCIYDESDWIGTGCFGVDIHIAGLGYYQDRNYTLDLYW